MSATDWIAVAALMVSVLSLLGTVWVGVRGVRANERLADIEAARDERAAFERAMAKAAETEVHLWGHFTGRGNAGKLVVGNDGPGDAEAVKLVPRSAFRDDGGSGGGMPVMRLPRSPFDLPSGQKITLTAVFPWSATSGVLFDVEYWEASGERVRSLLRARREA